MMSKESKDQVVDKDSILTEKELGSIFHSVNEAIFIHDLEGDIIDVNQPATEMYGYSREEFRNINIEDVSSGESPYIQEKAEKNIQRALNGEEPTFEWRGEDKKGNIFWVEVSLTQTVIDDEIRIIAIVRNINERKKRETELKKLKREYETVFKNAQDSLFLINVDKSSSGSDSDFQFTYTNINLSHERISGISKKEIRGKTPKELLGEKEGKNVEKKYRRCARKRETIKYEETLSMPEGDIIWETKLSPVIIDGEVTEIVGIARDITERKKEEKILREKTDQLDILNRIIRHDIRNDINIIDLYLENLLKQFKDKKNQKVVNEIEKVRDRSSHVTELTKISRDLAETIATEKKPKIKNIDLSHFLKEEIINLENSYRKIDIKIKDSIPDIDVLADEMLSSVFRNILHNAVQHNDKETPKIEVSVKEKQDDVIVSIADNGPGIHDNLKETVFGKGEKSMDSTGTGIGLYLVNQLIKNYNGDVWIEDNQPTGSIFKIKLKKG